VIVLFYDGEAHEVRPGDVVFSYDVTDPKYSWHVGLCIRMAFIGERLRVRGIPGLPPPRDDNEALEPLGDSEWLHWQEAHSPSEDGAYNVYLVGQRLDVSTVRIKLVKLISDSHVTELSLLSPPVTCHWEKREQIDYNRQIRDGIPLFLAGSCSQYIEYLYSSSGLPLIDRTVTRDPQSPGRIYPTTQIRAFWQGRYPLRIPEWREGLSGYPSCVSGLERSMTE
jgi:hypothetical protein